MSMSNVSTVSESNDDICAENKLGNAHDHTQYR